MMSIRTARAPTQMLWRPAAQVCLDRQVYKHDPACIVTLLLPRVIFRPWQSFLTPRLRTLVATSPVLPSCYYTLH